MSTTARPVQPPVPHRAATALLTLGIPALVAAAGTALVRSWRDELPARVATHVGPDGPDAFGTLASAVTPPLVLGAIVSLAMAALGIAAGRAASTRRTAAGVAVGTAVLLTVTTLGLLSLHRGLADAAAVGSVGPVVALAVGAAFAAAALAALLTPGDAPQPATTPVDPGAARVELAPGERATWVRYVNAPPAMWVALGGLVLAQTAVAAVVGDPLVALVAVPIALVAVVTTRMVVRVDGSGLVARSAIGYPRLTVPADEVLRASVVQVSAVRDFGGWGLRVGRGGRTGLVVRSGQALEVERTGGRVVVVTVDDAAHGAALLTSMAARGRTRGAVGPT